MPLLNPQLTPSQTIGPFFGNGLAWMLPATFGAVQISGQVFDGQGAPVIDALLEAWQPTATGPSIHPIAKLQRTATDADGRFSLYLAAPQGNAPAAYITLFARGLLRHVNTAVWLPGQSTHPLLDAVQPAARRGTLLAQANPNSGATYVWNICLQSSASGAETAFFEFQSP